MPRIRPYESQVGSQGDLPSRNAGLQDFGGAGLSNLGQGVENLGQSIGQIQRIENDAKSRQEVTDTHVGFIDAQARVHAELSERAKNYVAVDPETGLRNPMLSDMVPDILRRELDSLGKTPEGNVKYETPAGKNTFQLAAAQFSSHFVSAARDIDVKLAGDAAVQQFRMSVDKLGNAAFSAPIRIGDHLQAAETMLRDPYGIYSKERIGMNAQNKLVRDSQEAISTRAVEGLIEQDPRGALAALSQKPEERAIGSFDYIDKYIPNEKMRTLMNSAQTGVHALEVADAQASNLARQRMRDLSEATNSSLEQQRALHLIDPKQPPVTPQVVLEAAKTRGLDSEKQNMWLNMIEEQARRGPAVVHSNPAVKHKLFSDIIRPYNDPKKLTDTEPINRAYLRGQLNDTDMDWLVKKFTDGKSPDGDTLANDKRRFYKNVEQAITKPGPFGIFADPSTGIQLDRFVTDTENLVEEYIKKGKNPRDLFTFGKPEYRGSPSVLNEYQNKGFGSIDAPPAIAPAQPAKPKRSLDDIFKGK